MSGQEVSFLRNMHGLRIKRCCASCAHELGSRQLTQRRCRKQQRDVNPSDCCDEWKMKEQLWKGGRETGRVKRREYLAFLADERERESIATESGRHIVTKSIGQIREEFERDYGSVFLTTDFTN